MIGISKLYCGTVEPSDALRYGRRSHNLPSHLLQFSIDKKPVVVWNVTQACNLNCLHCYAHANKQGHKRELSNKQALTMIDDLAEFGVPVILFSGGEPLMRRDLLGLISYAGDKGMRAVISTNGTLITKEKAKALKEVDLSYVGISLDGMEEINDRFRGKKGAFKDAMEGIKNCQDVGLKVGLRFTINRINIHEIQYVFDLSENLNIPRVCFYHLVYAGRGSELIKQDLSHSETRQVVDLIIERTKDIHNRGIPKEVLTVDNHADGPYLYLKMVKEKNRRSDEVLQLLQMNEGNNSGRGIGCISWDGSVHADQFWRHHSFGNILERPFSRIWTDLSNPLMAKLKDKKRYVKGRCSSCQWLEICGGNLRVRAEAVTGDLWAPDPACYLTDEEISKAPETNTST
ncbi:MAG: 12,18-didecarboxysiroheme deacetylase [Desulfobacteraceae bacterium]|nr:12,18-didecarboxysiroheme deacetylase [Desulfobacteraceae bacterium]